MLLCYVAKTKDSSRETEKEQINLILVYREHNNEKLHGIVWFLECLIIDYVI